MSPAHEKLYRAAMKADADWSKELQRLYGKRAGDVRYTILGAGSEGSKLRKLYDARRRAEEKWRPISQKLAGF